MSSSSSKAVGSGGPTFFQQLRILMWKNIILQKRRWLSTLGEIGLPLYILFWLVLAKVIEEKKRAEKSSMKYASRPRGIHFHRAFHLFVHPSHSQIYFYQLSIFTYFFIQSRMENSANNYFSKFSSRNFGSLNY